MVVDVFEVLLARNAWEKRKWSQLVGISKNMVDPTTGKYDSLIHIGPGNIRSNSRELVDLKTVKDENLISGKFHFDKGDIIYGKINPQLAKYTIAPAEGLSSADTYVLKPKSGIERLFLYYTLGTNRFFKYTVSVSQRTGMPKINRDELNAYSLIIAPSLFEQKRIGLFLRKTDDLIAATQRRIDALEQAKKALLQRLFDQSWRFKGYSDPWEKRKLGELAKVRTGRAFKSSSFSPNGKYYVVTNKDIGGPQISTHMDGDRIDITNPVDIAKYSLSGRNLLVTMDGVNIGKTAMYSNEDAVLAQRVGRLTSSSLDFVHQITSQKNFLTRMNELSVGNAIKHISLKQISDYAVNVPQQTSERQLIGQTLSLLDNLIAATQSRLSSLELLKKSLLQDLFI
ncbi:restriction endonuclease subunit S [Lacticaseibacillus paracasei]|uniref:restriction endonuclease subunit S n=1 Tax=Lacticaseibacillus paracasei TaxID=1597 RepID=UPI000EB714B5|nr:restriction endonuclease subunit S [Lacticaseibacillus paracasei]AYG24230.1 restriction endonuclease subunit S [Lacticaseibacillus paracasei]